MCGPDGALVIDGLPPSLRRLQRIGHGASHFVFIELRPLDSGRASHRFLFLCVNPATANMSIAGATAARST